jgi:hypothetical protein
MVDLVRMQNSKALKHLANISIRTGLFAKAPIRYKGSFPAGWDRSSGLILRRWLGAFGHRSAASKLVWRRTVTGPKLSTPDRSHEGAADRCLRLDPSRRLTAPRRVLSIRARRKDQCRRKQKHLHVLFLRPQYLDRAVNRLRPRLGHPHCAYLGRASKPRI